MDCTRLYEALTTSVDKVSPVVLPNTEEVRPGVEGVAEGRETKKVSKVASKRVC